MTKKSDVPYRYIVDLASIDEEMIPEHAA